MADAIGILGGTFDPVHRGHIHLARTVWQGLALQGIRLIPCYQPLLRSPPVATPAQRLAMLQLAVADYPELTIDEQEMARGGYSYSVETLSAVRAELPTTPLCFILGSDQFAQFTRWRQWQNLFSLVHLVVVSRPGFVLSLEEELSEVLKQRQIYDIHPLAQSPAGSIFFYQMTPLDISATQIREKLQQGQDVSTWLPKKVWEYICENSLYR